MSSSGSRGQHHRKKRRGPSKYQRALSRNRPGGSARNAGRAGVPARRPSTATRPPRHAAVRGAKKKKSTGTYVLYVVVWVVVGAGVIAGIAYSQGGGGQSRTNPSGNQPADDGSTPTTSQYGTPYTVTTIEGASIPLSNYKGKVLVLYFWGISCPACSQQTPDLVSVYDDLKSDGGVEVVSLDIDGDSDGDLAQWQSDNGVTWKNCRDSGLELSSHFSIAYKPTTIVLDKDGNEARRFVGATSSDEIKAAIEAEM
ncbi:MAG: TlpA family protein disulfide reductase [Promethearchaeota archaeon]